MHILFVHQSFPAQFGHIAKYLIERHDFRCTFVSERPSGDVAGIELIQYQRQGGAREQTHFCARTFENQIWHSHALYEALVERTDLKPDLIVGHSGFTSTLFLKELFDCPVINYFEYFYRTKNSDFDFRHDLPSTEPIHAMRALARNALLLLDLENCDAGYSPTQWQRSQLPACFRDKVTAVFDGIDMGIWQRHENVERKVGNWVLPPDMKIVSYVSRGMESMRGFDIFMKVAKRVCDERDDVVFVVVGEDRVAYGGDLRFTDGMTFKQWVLSQDDFDLSRILFAGRISPPNLAQLFSLTDVHLYLTIPFVLSWSMMNALACGTIVVASDTEPVREMIRHEHNGLLVDFFDVDGFTRTLHRVLNDPAAHRPLGAAGRQIVLEQYSLEKCLPRMLKLYESVV
jgi:glycosyltransferase involved in cell wall biosynthesis